jgi:hypothetical protein
MSITKFAIVAAGITACVYCGSQAFVQVLQPLLQAWYNLEYFLHV